MGTNSSIIAHGNGPLDVVIFEAFYHDTLTMTIFCADAIETRQVDI